MVGVRVRDGTGRPYAGGALALRTPSGRDPWLIIVPLLLLALSLVGLVDRDLWASDEPRVAAVGRQVAEGAWIVPTLNGLPFLEQPPLHVWCVALLFRTFGFEHPEVSRWLSALFGLGGVLFTYLLASALMLRDGDRRRARRVGVLVALSLGISLGYLYASHKVVSDVALFCFTTGAACLLERGLSARRRAPRLGWLALGYSFTSLAFMAKGVIGIAIPGLAFLALAAADRDRRAFVRGHLWLAPFCFAALAGPWLYLLHRETGVDGFRAIFIDNTVGRIVPIGEGTRAHTGPIFEYLAWFPAYFMPSTLFFIGAVLGRIRPETLPIAASERRALDFALLWFAGGLTILSLASTKRPIYLLPLYPAAAIASGVWLDAYLRSEARGRYASSMKILLATLLVAIAIVTVIGSKYIPDASIPLALLGAVAAAGAALRVAGLGRQGRREAALASAIAGLAVSVLIAYVAMVPAVDARKGMGGLARQVATLVPPHQPIHALRPDEITSGVIPLYTGRPLVPIADEQELQSIRAETPDLYLLVVDREAAERGSRGWRKSRYGSLDEIPHRVLLEDLGDPRVGRRVFRLVQLSSSTTSTERRDPESLDDPGEQP